MCACVTIHDSVCMCAAVYVSVCVDVYDVCVYHMYVYERMIVQQTTALPLLSRAAGHFL